MEEAAGKSEVNPVPVRAVAGRAPYLTNITPAATKTIAAVGPPITRDRGVPVAVAGVVAAGVSFPWA